MLKTFTSLNGSSWQVCDDLLKEYHVIIGGTTGSGKSTFLQSILYSALIHSPAKYQFLFIDLKRVELSQYKALPHALGYATEIDQTIKYFDQIIKLIEKRFTEMESRKVREYPGNHIWIVIDELADLMQQAPEKITSQLVKIMRLGRAAHVHVLACTQSPNRRCLPAEICQNTTAAVALRCRSAIESRQIIGVSGAEKLPEYGRGIIWNAHGIKPVYVPLTPSESLLKRITAWN